MHNPSPFSFLKSHFAPAFFLLSAKRRRALSSLYSIFRFLDDVVDTQPKEVASKIVGRWREFFSTLDSSKLLEPTDIQRGAAVLLVFKEYDIPVFPFLDFIDHGLVVDLKSSLFRTPLDTENYCYGVAGTVGIACLPIFGVPWNAAKDYAIRLGIGVQWINIIRDVATDAKMGRVYLPEDHLEKFGLSADDILNGPPPRTFENLIQYEIEVARSHYRRAEELLPMEWKETLKPARMMGEIYMKLLAKIEKHHYAVMKRRIQLNFFEKAAFALRAVRS